MFTVAEAPAAEPEAQPPPELAEDCDQLYERLALQMECGAVAELLKEKAMLQVRNIRGRWPERRIPLWPEDMWLTTEETEPGRVRVRMENARCPAFWIEFDIVSDPGRKKWGS